MGSEGNSGGTLGEERQGSWQAVAAACVLVGIVVMVASWALGDGSRTWWSGALVNLGTSIVVFAPIYWATRVLDARIVVVRQDAARARDETTLLVGELGQQLEEVSARQESFLAKLSRDVEAERSSETQDDQALISSLRANPSLSALDEVNAIAVKRGWLRPNHDLRVRIGESDVFVSVPPSHPYRDLAFAVSPIGEAGDRVTWTASDEVGRFMRKLADAADRNLPAGERFSIDEFVNRYCDALEVALSDQRCHGLLTVFHPQWALTIDGLVAVGRNDDVIPTSGLRDPELRAALARHDWVDRDALDRVWKAIDAGIR